MGTKLVSIVVDYNGLADTAVCVESLLAQSIGDHRIIVIDNGSTLDDARGLRAIFGDRIHVVRLPQNLGFGGAANHGIRLANVWGAPYSWVLNNDTTIDRDTASILVDAMDADPTIGLASPQIRAPIGPEAPSGVWFAGGTMRLWRARAAHRLQRYDEALPPQDSPFLTGCALLIRNEILRDVGLFWEPLFLYWEDVDLSVRVLRAGWRTCVVPAAWIFHRIHGSTDDRLASYYLFRNALLVAWRNAGAATVASATFFLVLRLVRRWGRALVRRGPAPWSAARGLWAGFRMVIEWTIRRRDRTAGIEGFP